MFRQEGLTVYSADSDQTLTSAMQEVIFTGSGTTTRTYTLPEIAADGVYGSKVFPGRVITIRNAASTMQLLSIAKHANDTGIYLGSSTSVTSFLLHPGSSVKLVASDAGYWTLIDGTNFFDQWDDLEFLGSARASVNTSATLADIGNGVEVWRFQHAGNGGSPDKWLMLQRQMTHGWDKQPVQFHVHFSPVNDIVATGTGIVVTWTLVWRLIHPGGAQAWADQSNITMTYSLASGTMDNANNYNASVGGNNSETTWSINFPSTIFAARLELTSVTNNGVSVLTPDSDMFMWGFDAHIKLRKRGTILAFPEP